MSGQKQLYEYHYPLGGGLERTVALLESFPGYIPFEVDKHESVLWLRGWTAAILAVVPPVEHEEAIRWAFEECPGIRATCDRLAERYGIEIAILKVEVWWIERKVAKMAEV